MRPRLNGCTWLLRIAPLAAAATLAGCQTQPLNEPQSERSTQTIATRWYSPLPEARDTVDAARWWDRFDDPVLLALIQASQRVSSTLAQAGARIAEARAAHTSSNATLLPTVDAGLSASRGRQGPGAPAAATASLGLQASWELDLFGANQTGARAAQARLEASELAWHAAKVSLAAEVASAYVDLRSCEAQVVQGVLDVHSRAETARLTTESAAAGLQAPAAVDLARASAAGARAALNLQRAQCEPTVKSLVALSGIEEAGLRRQLDHAAARLPRPPLFRVSTVPAEVLSQRPDVAVAALELSAASADSDQARAMRWPRVTLSGNVGPARQWSAGISTAGTVWSIGPIVVTVPIFDAGVRRANAEAAQARYDACRAAYAGSLRSAVREVETALVVLASATLRGDDLEAAATGLERSYAATHARQSAGLASLFELEDARRSLLAARSALIEQQRAKVLAWISLYRAAGGGWTAWAPNSSPIP